MAKTLFEILREHNPNKDEHYFSDFIQEEDFIAHSLIKNTVECYVHVDILDPNGIHWKGERIIKIRLKPRRKEAEG